MLTALALNQNTPVSMDRIVDALWPLDPPVSVRDNVRTYVTGLRRRLHGGDPAVALLATEGGYLLKVPSEQVDATMFAALVTSAREKRAAGKVDDAAAELTQALRLWRGSAGEGLPRESWLGNALLTLDEQRMLVVEERVRLWLELGRHAELVPELMGELTGRPLRESLWRYLMLAQYGCGDTAEALASYEKARKVLTVQLGVEPGPALADLHRAILRRDPALRRHDPELVDAPVRRADGSPVGTLPIPRQIPAPPVDLVDRQLNSRRIEQALQGGAPGPIVVSVTGPPGTGKSALARRVAHTVTHRFPDGQLYVDLREFGQPSDPAAMLTVIRALLRGLGLDHPPFTTVSEAAALLRSSMAGRRILVLIDNAVSAWQVGYLLPAYPGSAAIITSCRLLDLGIVSERVTLGPLPPTDGMAVLRNFVGDERIRAEPEAARKLLDLCDGAPLALKAVGRHLTRQSHSAPIQHLYDRVRSDPRILDDLRFDGQRSAEPVAIALTELRAAECHASAALIELSALGRWLEELAISTLTGPGAGTRIDRGAVDTLLDFHLVRPQGRGFVVPDVVRRQTLLAATDPATDDPSARIGGQEVW
ncbi:BTAD domain-containing putative transcriptional regulator [Verrucosispora sp. WMMA2121]|uniref:AfsR/SARP family transcriptional regulator n=1 Tax=Verrucosispora sp. WMMA2121 TaxID=3015164 RepID=UPI0022B6C988|nr:BTAD domain-containing putative transcriptional regulator [Verrucosispora sp. WMMA2121]MCZ7418852.1 BTAD domain-containing putative transcriptional regulator [Verrucosispora sp. WMMA2121]